MTVQELIEALGQFDGGLTVYVQPQAFGYSPEMVAFVANDGALDEHVYLSHAGTLPEPEDAA